MLIFLVTLDVFFADIIEKSRKYIQVFLLEIIPYFLLLKGNLFRKELREAS
jgi:hypothetical protein